MVSLWKLCNTFVINKQNRISFFSSVITDNLIIHQWKKCWSKLIISEYHTRNIFPFLPLCKYVPKYRPNTSVKYLHLSFRFPEKFLYSLNGNIFFVQSSMQLYVYVSIFQWNFMIVFVQYIFMDMYILFPYNGHKKIKQNLKNKVVLISI